MTLKSHPYTLNVQMDGDTGKDDIKESPLHAECEISTAQQYKGMKTNKLENERTAYPRN